MRGQEMREGWNVILILYGERRLGDLNHCLCGDGDLDNERELRLLSLFRFPRLQFCVRVWPSLVVWREKPDLDLERLIMGRIASDMAATDACTADCITFSSDVLSICVAMVGVFPSSPPWIKLLLAL